MAKATVAGSKPLNRASKPPRPPLVLHIGVIGHRPDPEKRAQPDVTALRAVVASILRQIKSAVAGIASAKRDLFAFCRDDERPGGSVRIISSLAEGADQWVAGEALEIGFELQTPLPFAIDEYAKDFAGTALCEFNRLKDQAKTVLELDGCRARERESYEAAARIVIGQSDLVIALWDGKDEVGRGGTAQMVRESLRNGVPVIWIKWASPELWQVLDTMQWRVLQDVEGLQGEFSRLNALIGSILLPPDLNADKNRLVRSNGRERYYREDQRRWNLVGCLWRMLRSVVLVGPPGCKLYLGAYEDKTRRDWDEEWNKSEGLNKSLVDWIDRPYLSHYAWANQSALHYGDLHRSSSVLNYLLGTVAVLCALLGISALVYGERDLPAILVELASIGAIIFLTFRGTARHWHERWIQYRILAERLRIARFLDLLGGARQHFTLPGHLGTYGNPANTWVYWHYRAVVRAAGLPNLRLDADRLEAVQATWRDILIQNQIDYHQSNARNLSVIDRRLHWIANSLFVGTFVACAVHFALALRTEMVPVWAGIPLVTANALLPAIGAALAAIRNQGEFRRIAQRSVAMREELEELKLALCQIAPRGHELKSQEMRRVMEQTARLMINETLDWRIVFQDRPLILPA